MHVVRSLEYAALALFGRLLDDLAFERHPRTLLLVGCLVVHVQLVVQFQSLDLLLFLGSLFLGVAGFRPQVVRDLEGGDFVRDLLLFGLERLFELQILQRLIAREAQEIQWHDVLAQVFIPEFDRVLVLQQPKVSSFQHLLFIFLSWQEDLLDGAAAPHSVLDAHGVALGADHQVSRIQRLQCSDELSMNSFRLHVLSDPGDFDCLSCFVHLLYERCQPGPLGVEIRLADGALVLALAKLRSVVDDELELVLFQNHVLAQL